MLLKNNLAEKIHNKEKTIAKGAFINTLGTIGKALIPLYFILIARLFGPKIMGIYYLTFTISSIAIKLTVSGLNDGVLMFASKFDYHIKKEDKIYSILANGFVISLAISTILIILSQIGGPELIRLHYWENNIVFGDSNITKIIKISGTYHANMLIKVLQIMTFSLPFVVIPTIIIAATKSLLIMKWDALIMGFLRPFLLISCSIIAYLFNMGIYGLAASFLIANIILTFISCFVFKHYFSYKKLIKNVFKYKFNKKLIAFAIPQNLNMTFNTFITNLDVIMLGYFNFNPEIIGFYGMGAQLINNVNQIRIAFSGIFSPIITRLHSLKKSYEINNSFSMVSRWTAIIALPVLLIIITMKTDLLRIFHSSFTSDSTFMILLCIPPLISCTIGLAGNIIIMTGHSMWNLINSLTITGINFILNLILIPKLGIIGAALATAIASTTVSILQLIECNYLLKVKIIIKKIYFPFVAIIPSTLLIIGLSNISPFKTTISRILITLAAVCIYLLVLYKIKPSNKIIEYFFPWEKPKK